jgi:hypothetical protein
MCHPSAQRSPLAACLRTIARLRFWRGLSCGTDMNAPAFRLIAATVDRDGIADAFEPSPRLSGAATAVAAS